MIALAQEDTTTVKFLENVSVMYIVRIVSATREMEEYM